MEINNGQAAQPPGQDGADALVAALSEALAARAAKPAPDAELDQTDSALAVLALLEAFIDGRTEDADAVEASAHDTTLLTGFTTVAQWLLVMLARTTGHTEKAILGGLRNAILGVVADGGNSPA